MRHSLSLLLAASCFAACAARADITPAELGQRIARGDKLTVIDVRSTSLFQQGHIENAINIPASLVPAKQLPPIGAVVVYDSGLGTDEAAGAVAALNRKPGIRAEALAGGFAAWESTQGTSTRPSGLQDEELPMITYDDLQKAQSEQVVLVDLRKRPAAALQRAGAAEPAPPLTDLKATFPKVAAVTQSPFHLPNRRQGSDSVAPLLVLIDSGSGTDAQAMARTLRANGVRRVVILAGGEEILVRGGKAGLQRIGSTLEFSGQQK